MVVCRGISVSVHQWGASKRIEAKGGFDGGGEPVVYVKLWEPYRNEREDGEFLLDMTHFDLCLQEETAILLLQQLAKMYPTACMEALTDEAEEGGLASYKADMGYG
jgi:hypothetical protein